MKCNCGIENGGKVNINGGHSLPNDAPYSYSLGQNREQQLKEKERRTYGEMEGEWNEKTYGCG